MMKRKISLMIILGVCVFILLRIPSLFEPYWYGDEGIYASVALEMKRGEALYTQIWDNKPPIIYWTYILCSYGKDFLFNLRLLNIVTGILTLIGVFKLVKKLFNSKLAFITFSISIILLGLPILEGNITNAENIFLPLIVWGYYLVVNQSKNKGRFILVGVFLSLAFLYKLVAGVSFAALFLYLIVIELRNNKSKNKSINLKNIILIILGFVTPIILLIVWELYKGTFIEFINTTLVDMVIYVGYGGEDWLGLVFLKFTGPAKIILTTVFVCLVGINFLKGKISKRSLFISFVFLFEFLGVLISSRGYNHYLLQLIPSLMLIVSLFLEKLAERKDVLSRINLTVFFSMFCYLCLIVFTRGKPISLNYGSNIADSSFKVYKYYESFYEYKISKNKSRYDYNGFFNNEENDLIGIKELINNEYSDIPGNKIYIYTNNSWVYPFLEIPIPVRYSVAYHQNITRDGTEILFKEIKELSPDLIVADKSVQKGEKFEELLEMRYIIDYESNGHNYYIKKGEIE